MKKISSFWISTLVGLAIGYIAVCHLLQTNGMSALEGSSLPAGFPTAKGLLVIWGILFVLWGTGSRFVFSAGLSPRRMRNIFLNGLILIIGIFIWNFLVFEKVNFEGALAVAIAILLLALVVWFMYLVTHRYGGYLFISMMVWLVFLLYLSIALVIKN